MKIGIFGGTFNPPHNGHKLMLEKIKNRLKLDKIIVIPSNLPPHKEVSDNAPTHRINMAKLAFKRYNVSDMEILRGGKSYTYMTILELKKQFPKDKLYFICGSDMFLSFDSWMKPQVIFDNATIVTTARDNNEYFKLFCAKLRFYKEYHAHTRIVLIKPFPISSTEIRKMVKENNLNSGLIDNSVKEYIQENGLYL